MLLNLHIKTTCVKDYILLVPRMAFIYMFHCTSNKPITTMEYKNNIYRYLVYYWLWKFYLFPDQTVSGQGKEELPHATYS